jgi:hypothetical protein
MERRWSRRKQVIQDVLLRREGLGVLRCETRDISFEGACIETGLISVPASIEIELIFTHDDQYTAEVVRIGAQVVRAYGHGIGVNFQHYYDGSHRFLLKLLD